MRAERLSMITKFVPLRVSHGVAAMLSSIHFVKVNSSTTQGCNANENVLLMCSIISRKYTSKILIQISMEILMGIWGLLSTTLTVHVSGSTLFVFKTFWPLFCKCSIFILAKFLAMQNEIAIVYVIGDIQVGPSIHKKTLSITCNSIGSHRKVPNRSNFLMMLNVSFILSACVTISKHLSFSMEIFVL